MILTGRQLRDARFRAGLAPTDLANRSGMDRDRLIYAETMYGAPAWTEEEFARVHQALEAAGVELVREGGALGVRRREVEPRELGP